MGSENGLTDHITSDASFMYDWVEISPENEKVLTGGGKAMMVTGLCSLNLKMHSTTDFHVKLTGVYVTEGIGVNPFAYTRPNSGKKTKRTRTM